MSKFWIRKTLNRQTLTGSSFSVTRLMSSNHSIAESLSSNWKSICKSDNVFNWNTFFLLDLSSVHSAVAFSSSISTSVFVRIFTRGESKKSCRSILLNLNEKHTNYENLDHTVKDFWSLNRLRWDSVKTAYTTPQPFLSFLPFSVILVRHKGPSRNTFNRPFAQILSFVNLGRLLDLSEELKACFLLNKKKVLKNNWIKSSPTNSCIKYNSFRFIKQEILTWDPWILIVTLFSVLFRPLLQQNDASWRFHPLDLGNFLAMSQTQQENQFHAIWR